MKSALRTSATIFATVATAGASTLFFGVGPAAAADTEACGTTGDVVAPGVCEADFTSGTSTFTPTAQMTKLEVLLVGAGGNGTNYQAENMKGYAAGGGGEVKVVDFTGTTDPITVAVPTSGTPGQVSDGTTTADVNNGGAGSVDPDTGVPTGGTSGSGFAGSTGPTGGEVSGAAGGGAGGAASGLNGGAGVVVGTIAPSGSLFSGDTRCFGGGGADSIDGTIGIPGCGAGWTDEDGNTVSPEANSGGGATSSTTGTAGGADGFVAIRWNAADVTVTFDMKGHGTAPADQTFPAGSTATEPTEPTAASLAFGGWYTDAALTTRADFSDPITASTTLYARWLPALAATGADVDPATLWIGFGSLVVGAGLITAASRRRRRMN